MFSHLHYLWEDNVFDKDRNLLVISLQLIPTHLENVVLKNVVNFNSASV